MSQQTVPKLFQPSQTLTIQQSNVRDYPMTSRELEGKYTSIEEFDVYE